MPGSLKAWHQGKRLGCCLAAGLLLPALEPESAPKLGWSSMGRAADDAQSPPKASWACLAGSTSRSWSVKLEVGQKAAAACIQVSKMMPLQLSP